MSAQVHRGRSTEQPTNINKFLIHTMNEIEKNEKV